MDNVLTNVEALVDKWAINKAKEVSVFRITASMRIIGDNVEITYTDGSKHTSTIRYHYPGLD